MAANAKVDRDTARDAELLRVLMPGRVVPVKGFNAKLTVYPLGLRHLRDFPELMSRMAGGFLAAFQSTKGDTESRVRQTVDLCLPMIMHHGVRLLMECVACDAELPAGTLLSDVLPAHALPLLAGAWIEESFGDEEFRRPWREAIETAASKLAKRPVRISEIISKILSPPVTVPPKSSTTDSPASPTEAGPSPSSDSGSPAPSGSATEPPPTS